jgi:hypothetical protein
MHGDDDQIVPYADSAPLSAETAEEWYSENLQRLSAWYAHD